MENIEMCCKKRRDMQLLRLDYILFKPNLCEKKPHQIVKSGNHHTVKIIKLEIKKRMIQPTLFFIYEQLMLRHCFKCR